MTPSLRVEIQGEQHQTRQLIGADLIPEERKISFLFTGFGRKTVMQANKLGISTESFNTKYNTENQ